MADVVGKVLEREMNVGEAGAGTGTVRSSFRHGNDRRYMLIVNGVISERGNSRIFRGRATSRD